ncbi:hypothetical protein F5B21DRAFT_524672 [Xylaria acuta]|nr:hypothetical protein F5B21DRAFT_524672 [Xylaria acuta]
MVASNEQDWKSKHKDVTKRLNRLSEIIGDWLSTAAGPLPPERWQNFMTAYSELVLVPPLPKDDRLELYWIVEAPWLSAQPVELDPVIIIPQERVARLYWLAKKDDWDHTHIMKPFELLRLNQNSMLRGSAAARRIANLVPELETMIQKHLHNIPHMASFVGLALFQIY